MQLVRWEQGSVSNDSGSVVDGAFGDLKPRERTVAAQAARRAGAHLADRLKVNPSEITLQRVIPGTWPDTSLGCPEPDCLYAQVLTAGYVVILVHGKDTYEYRTDGKQSLVCVGLKDGNP
jgi:hypothetical protein